MVAFHFLYIQILTRKLFKLSQPLWNFGTNSGALSVPFQKVYFSSFLRVSFCGIDKIRTNSASFNRFNEGFEILNLPRLGFAIPYNWPRFTSAERWLINHHSWQTSSAMFNEESAIKKRTFNGKCVLDHFFFSPRAPWPTESKRFCYLWVLNDDDSTRSFCLGCMEWYDTNR